MANKTLTQTMQKERLFFNKVYGWMSFALFITGFSSFYVISSKTLLQALYGNPFLLFGLILLELGTVFYLSSNIQKMSLQTARITFIAYSILNGVTLSGLFMVYTGASVTMAFLITALTFSFMSIYGYTTQTDLTDMGKLMFVGLIGIVIASVINIFAQSSVLYWAISYIGVIVFIGLTAYDTQKIKQMMHQIVGDEDTYQKYAILGALTLYLDFINLFIMILRIVGNRRD
ncbi:MAG: hypothetical protein A2Y40_00610 [Candidatus Margulisbacteria bacterium GWF2_35_9]|nr:MAG: hypothetical protein A2Y40_00610 [Candidatus Margulisbacteria bacterium GWF2_35_9]